MLDIETKSRINTARDILVGKVPDPKSQVEQITIALIYKFMDDMDVESEELGGKRTFFVGEYGKYAWRKIFDPRQSGYELLNLYSEAIQKMDTNPGVPKLFRDIFKNAYLPYRDPETLKSFLKIINEFDYSHSEKLGDAFEFLLSILGSQGDAGQFRTPRHIIDFMVEIIDPKKHETILDPACGTAGFLISSYKHIIKQNSSNYNPEESTSTPGNGNQTVNELIITSNGYRGDKLTPEERKKLADNMHGYDISPDMVRLSLVNMYLHGIKEPHISEYDTLTSEEQWNQYSDVILANPPFMSPKGGIRPHKRFSITSNRSEVLFVDYIAEHLTPEGRAAVIVPEGIIFQSGKAYKALRKMLVEQYLVGVISLPAGVFNPYSGVKTSILWLDKVLAKKTDKILFVKIENDGFDLGAQRRAIKENDLIGAVESIIKYKANITTGKAYEISTDSVQLVEKASISKSGEYILVGDRYTHHQATQLSFPMVSLGDDTIFDVESGGTPNTEVSEYWNGDISWLTLVDLPKSDFVTEIYDSERKITNTGLQKSSAKIIAPNSVIVSSRATIGRVGINRVPLATNQGFKNIIIKNKKIILPEYLAYMMTRQKDTMERLASGGTFKEISKTNFCTLQIPLPPLSIQKEIIEEIGSYRKIIDGARMVVENYKPRIDINPAWETVELGEICNVVSGYAFNSKDFSKDNLTKCIKITNVGVREFVVDTEDNLPEEFLTLYSGFRVDKGDVVISLTRSIISSGLKVTKVPSNWDNSLLNQRVAGIKAFEGTNIDYVYLYLCTDSVYKYVEEKSRSLMQPNLSIIDLKKLPIPFPPLDIQEKIVQIHEQEQLIVTGNEGLIKNFEQKIKDRIAKGWGE